MSFSSNMSLLEGARTIALRLRQAGFLCYFAGGCVRDRLLGEPLHDVDIATSARPVEVLRLFPEGRSVGAHFGVIIVPVEGVYYDVATFRTDGVYRDGRRPECVVFSSPQEDAQRRDFTVNGMFEDPETGEIVDFVGGMADLKNKVLRCIGEPAARFREDSLRLMRAVRFAVTKGFEIEPSTWQAICDHAGLLSRIAIERIHDELNKILLAPRRRVGVEMLADCGLMNVFIPELLTLKGCEQPPQWHPEGDVWTHTMMMLDRLLDEGQPVPSLELVLSVLLHDIGKPPTRFFDETAQTIRFNGHAEVGRQMCSDILRRLHYPNAVVDAVSSMVGRHMSFCDIKKMRRGKLRQFMASPWFDDELRLHRADCLSSNGLLDNYQFMLDQKKEFEVWKALPKPLLNGRDLIDAGLSPGPYFKRLLNDLYLEQLDGRLATREEALAKAHAWWRANKLENTPEGNGES